QVPGVHAGGRVLPDVHRAGGEGGGGQRGGEALEEHRDPGALVPAEGEQRPAVEHGRRVGGGLGLGVDAPSFGDLGALVAGRDDLPVGASGGGEVRDERPVPGGGERERERVRAEHREGAAERGGDGAGRGGEHGGETVGRELVRPESAGAV